MRRRLLNRGASSDKRKKEKARKYRCNSELGVSTLIEANTEELARLESLDTAHPIRGSRNLEVPRSAGCYRYFGGMADKFQGTDARRGELRGDETG